jgi:hydroxylamine dehydrogenase
MWIQYTRPALIFLTLVAAGMAWSGLEEPEQGVGLYGSTWKPDPMHEYWDPETLHRPEREQMEGRFQTAECLACHEGVTPGIVKDWRASRHAAPSNGKPVGCDGCHGHDHQALVFPGPATCGNCHKTQHGAFLDERRYGFPSHALAMERAVDAPHFADKPKPEVLACLQCHSVATKCDACHTRHRFDAAEARRPEACITCHSGPPHPDDEAFFHSAHGRIYRNEGADWDWSQPLRKGNYKIPTCAYCHLRDGNHQVADKAIHKFGIREVNPATAENRIKRKRWQAVCADCHPSEKARIWLSDLDRERQTAWPKLYQAERMLKSLRSDGLLYPSARERPAYPMDWLGTLWPRARIGFYEGQASALYNVSPIERNYFEMWYFDNLRAYKGAAHGAPDMVREGHARMDRSLMDIEKQAGEMRDLDGREKAVGVTRPDPRPLWREGEYTRHNREEN